MKVIEDFCLGKVTLKNRFVYPAITTALASRAGQVTEEMISYYRKRAEGGTGLIIVEPGIVAAEGNLIFKSLGIYDDEFLPGLIGLAQTIKQSGARAFIQLAHVGPKGHIKINKEIPQAASAVEVVRGQVPREMTGSDIALMVERFAMAAFRAYQAGFEGVELHAAHFYLLSSFLSPYTNQRQDEYGSNLQGRCRVIQEITKAIKERVGTDFPVICRINAAELAAPGIDVRDAVEMAIELEQTARIDGLHVSSYNLPQPEGGYYTIAATCIPGPDDPAGIFVEYAAQIKKAVNIPVIAVGKINELQLAERVVSEEKADLVAIGRQMIADPDTVNKWLAGSEFVDCINCNRCLSSIGRRSIACSVNEKLF